MTTRNVIGTIRNAAGSPLANTPITFALSPGSFTASDQYVPSIVTAVTDAFGRFQATLWANGEGAQASLYTAMLPGDSFTFVLPPGAGEVEISALRTASPLPANWQITVQSLIDTHAAVRASASILGHVKVGANLAIDPDGTLNAPAGGTAGTYTHTQASPVTEWIINHNLGFNPSVELRTTGGSEFDAEIVHLSVTQARVFLTTATAGTARCT